MKGYFRLPGLLAIALMPAMISLAQQQEATEQTPSAAQKEETAPATAIDKPPVEKTKGKGADRDFTPSEEISEDLSVPFPADI